MSFNISLLIKDCENSGLHFFSLKIRQTCTNKQTNPPLSMSPTYRTELEYKWKTYFPKHIGLHHWQCRCTSLVVACILLLWTRNCKQKCVTRLVVNKEMPSFFILKLNSYSNESVFSSLSNMCIFDFEVISVYPIDRYQKHYPKSDTASWIEKKFNFKSVSHSWHMIVLVIAKQSA